MENRNYLHRLLFTIKKLRACGYATFEELSVYIQREFELRDGAKKISIRTFQRDMATIRELFNIDIKCNRSNQYYIAEDDQTGFNNRILEAFDTFNALNISDQISNFIHFEKRKPQGTENLYELLHAIRNKLQIRFTYQKYWEDEITLRRAEPYALKEFKNRWYILANDLKDGKIKSFALDRLSALEITKKSFPFPNDFDVNSYFKNCFGIMGPNAAKPSEVILSFEPFQGKYIKSLPLHESQEILIDNELEVRVKVSVFLTHDFLMEVLSYGENVKIIQPVSLIEEVKETLNNALKQY